MGHGSLGAVQLLLEFAKAEVWKTKGGTQKCDAFVVSSLPPRRGLRRVTLMSFPVKACEEGLCGFVGAADGSSRWKAPCPLGSCWTRRGREGILSGPQDDAVVRAAQVTVPGQSVLRRSCGFAATI